MKRWWGAVALAVMTGLAGCAALLGPRTIVVSQPQLQQLVERRFPIERRVLELFDVTVAPPQLELRPDANRLATQFDLRVVDRVFRVEHRRRIALNAGLRYEPADRSVRLTNVQVDRLDIDGAPALLRQQLDRVAVVLAEQLLSEQPLYTLRPKDIEAVEGRGYRPGEIRVTPLGVLIRLDPEPSR